MVEVLYDPSCYNVRSLSDAKRIILTEQEGRSPEERWETESPYLASLVAEKCEVNAFSILLDYGCGVGRLSKPLIEKVSCSVVGVDTSPSMRALSAQYVSHDRFLACAPDALRLIVRPLHAFDVALAVWVLQHVPNPEREIYGLHRSLNPSVGRLFVVNNLNRCVPTDRGWCDDGIDLRALLEKWFGSPESEGLLDPEIVGDRTSATTFWAVYRRRG